MSKPALKAVVATVLAITAIILYGQLHDISQLTIFQNPLISDSVLGERCLPFFSRVHHGFMCNFTQIPFWRILNNHLVDALWFISFSLYMQALLEKPISYILCIAMAVLSECSQLFFPQLGTFDACDLLLYALILAALYVIEKVSLSKKKRPA